jgi:hypothetical protein
MPIEKRARARVAAVVAFVVCLPVGFYVGITLIGHARFIPYVSTSVDRVILAGAVLGMPALAACTTYRFMLAGHGVLAAASFWVGGGALALGAAAFVAFYLSTYLDALDRERVARRTRISNVRDEPIVTRDGHPIGVRVSFAAEFPSKRRPHEFQPQLSEHDRAATGTAWSVPGLSLDVRQVQVDGAARFQLSDHRQPDLAPGRHELALDLYPHVVHVGMDGDPCLAAGPRPQVPDAGTPIRLRVVIPVSSYGAHAGAGEAGETRNAYDIVAMYRAVLGGAVQSCPEQR